MEEMTKFRITYDGPALATHEMDARDLAPALLAMADLLDASVKALHGDRAKAQINVKGSFKTGSFNIDFNTAVSFVKAVKDIFAGDGMTAVANAIAVLGFLGFVGKKGVTHALKWMRGRRITNVQIEQSGLARIFCDQDSIEVEIEVLTLLRDVAVRESLDQVLAPLDREGVDTFAAGTDTQAYVVIDQAERAYFAPPAGVEELLLEDTRRMVFSILSLAFKDDNKWRLSDGTSTINALISDAGFLAGVNSNEISFSKGDVLICNVLVKQWLTQSGARTEYEIVEVIEHRHAARQIPLPGIDPVKPIKKSPRP